MRHERLTWREGDEGVEVEWCKTLPTLPDDPTTFDRDNAVMVRRDFRDRDQAYAYARGVFPQDQFGCVTVTPFVLEKLAEDYAFSLAYNCHKLYTDESDVYDGG